MDANGRNGTDISGGREDRRLGAPDKTVPHLSPAELLAWRGLLETEARLIPYFDSELRERDGMSVNEFDALYQLWIGPNMRRRMKELAAALLVTPGGVTRLATRLEGRGWVRRLGKRGTQAVDVELTRLGLRTLERAMDTHFAGVARMFVARLSPKEIRQLVVVWRKLRSGATDEEGE